MPKLILAAVSLILSINVFVLVGVAYNRSGDPVVTIALTERELPVYRSYASADENSGTSLSLKYQVFDPDNGSDYNYSHYNSPLWLDRKKLTDLGFDIEALEKITDDKYYKINNISNEAILVLEYQGETYSKVLLATEQQLVKIQDEVLKHPEDEALTQTLAEEANALKRFKVASSRLYVVDAGLDLQALIKQYPDKGKYVFARAEIGLSWNDEVIEGRIEQLLINRVYVALPASEQLSSLSLDNGYYKYNDDVIPPRYRVNLKIGQRLEPWIESVKFCSESDC